MRALWVAKTLLYFLFTRKILMRSESKRRWDQKRIKKNFFIPFSCFLCTIDRSGFIFIYMIDLSMSIPVGTRKMVNYA